MKATFNPSGFSGSRDKILAEFSDTSNALHNVDMLPAKGNVMGLRISIEGTAYNGAAHTPAELPLISVDYQGVEILPTDFPSQIPFLMEGWMDNDPIFRAPSNSTMYIDYVIPFHAPGMPGGIPNLNSDAWEIRYKNNWTNTPQECNVKISAVYGQEPLVQAVRYERQPLNLSTTGAIESKRIRPREYSKFVINSLWILPTTAANIARVTIRKYHDALGEREGDLMVDREEFDRFQRNKSREFKSPSYRDNEASPTVTRITDFTPIITTGRIGKEIPACHVTLEGQTGATNNTLYMVCVARPDIYGSFEDAVGDDAVRIENTTAVPNSILSGGNQFAGGGNQFAGGGNQFAGGGNQFAGGGNQFAGGGTLAGGSPGLGAPAGARAPRRLLRSGR